MIDQLMCVCMCMRFPRFFSSLLCFSKLGVDSAWILSFSALSTRGEHVWTCSLPGWCELAGTSFLSVAFLYPMLGNANGVTCFCTAFLLFILLLSCIILVALNVKERH